MKKKITCAIMFIIILLVGGWVWIQYEDVRGPGLNVLLYHEVEINGSKNKYTLKTEVFERQLQWLKKNGYTTILPKEISNHTFHKNPEKTIMLTFDDGTIDHFETVYPLLKKYGFGGVFFIITGEINKGGRLTSEHIKQMFNNGMEIGSHTVSHPYLDTLDESEIERQLHLSKQTLEKITGNNVISFAPPGGWFNGKAEKIAHQQGYDFLFSCEIGLNDLTEKLFVYKRIEVLRKTSLAEFQDLLVPTRVFEYKLEQSLKFVLHWLIGTDNYVNLSHAI